MNNSIRNKIIIVFCLFFLARPLFGSETKIAVFNFQMKSESPEWVWLEKGLSDCLITDLFKEDALIIIRRDAMQKLADNMMWAPEMMSDPHRLEVIRRAFKPDYLVSGIYEILDKKVLIVASIVNLENEKEVFRTEISGPENNILGLMREMNSKILSWLTNRPEEKILPELKAWSRNVPATKALYEGMNLYDQGHYRKAWKKFRQAAKHSPDYVEAQYWIGKMYYFMDRYEHARTAYDNFVFITQDHPRLGDAIKEYLHTYEKLDTEPEKLLELYDHLSEKYPETRIHNVLGTDWLGNEFWVWTKKARVLERLRRHAEAAVLAGNVVGKLSGKQGDPWRKQSNATPYAYCISMRNAQIHNMLTGKVIMPEGLKVYYQSRPMQFAPGQTELISYWPWPFRTLPRKDREGRTYWRNYYAWWFVAAPDDHVFKKIHFFPIVKEYGRENEVEIGLLMHKDSYADTCPSKGGGEIRLAEREGVEFSEMPKSGLFHAHAYLGTSNRYKEPGTYISGVRAVAEFEKLRPHGAIDVSCDNCADFSVDVDGKKTRKKSGLIGLVPPGKHKLRFYHEDQNSIFGEVTKEVTVHENKVVKISATLPWKKGIFSDSWKPTSLIGRDYPSGQFNVGTTMDCPSIQADHDTIRIVWSRGNDLWAAVSTNGKNFSVPAKLPMPISSGWNESKPILLRDISGRFILLVIQELAGASYGELEMPKSG